MGLLLLPAPAAAIRPGPATARAWLERELSRPNYHQSLLQRVWAWLGQWWDQLRGAALAASPLSAAVVLALVLAVAVLAVLAGSRVRRDPVRGVGRPADLLDPATTARRHRADAEAALEAGRLDEALVEAFRALATEAVERGLVEDRPGLTARELAGELVGVLPGRRADLAAALDRFEAVLYAAGDPVARERTRSDVSVVLALHDTVRTHRRPPAYDDGGAHGAHETVGAVPEVSARTALRRHRGLVAGAVAVLAALGVLSVLTVSSPVHAGDLDPQNPQPEGAQALARVLDDHGVGVTVVRRAAQLQRTTLGPGTTVVVTSSQALGRGSARSLARVARAAGALVLAAPDPTLVDALGLPLVATGPAGAEPTHAGCADRLLARLTVRVDRSTGYRSTGPGVTGCFPGGSPRVGSLVSLVDGAVPTYVVGGDRLFANARVRQADNAAVALRLLGQRGHLVWYVPDRRDIAVGDRGSLAAQLPRGLVPALWLVAAAGLAALLWRGRRLGPLVTEPLPVVVAAIESTQGRGRLYRHVQDRGHAATILRRAAAGRLAARLRIPAEHAAPGSPALVNAVARATRRPAADVDDLLALRTIGDDRALARLSADLTALEKEVLEP